MSASDDLPTRSLRRVPLWPFVVLVIALLASLFVWFRWRDEVLERRAIARLQALPGVRIEPKGSRILRGAFAGPNPWYIHLFGPTSAGVYSLHLTEPLPASARHDLAAFAMSTSSTRVAPGSRMTFSRRSVVATASDGSD